MYLYTYIAAHTAVLNVIEFGFDFDFIVYVTTRQARTKLKTITVCMCVCFLPIHSGHQVRWTYQPGSHRRKVTQDFSSTFFITIKNQL